MAPLIVDVVDEEVEGEGTDALGLLSRKHERRNRPLR
jgi:hypothetical protein